MFPKNSKNCYFNVDFIPCRRHDGRQASDPVLPLWAPNCHLASGNLGRFLQKFHYLPRENLDKKATLEV